VIETTYFHAFLVFSNNKIRKIVVTGIGKRNASANAHKNNALVAHFVSAIFVILIFKSVTQFFINNSSVNFPAKTQLFPS
jgi:hypothetical protein